jgi:K+-transporting ATPase ATPase C chain
MRRQLATGFFMVLAMTVLCGLLYPLVVLGASQVAFKSKANGSIVTVNGTEVGSSLIGQNFTAPKYFHPRPSAAGKTGYDALASSPSNLGPTNDELISDCLPVPATGPDGNPVVDVAGNPVNERNPDGTLVCDPNTVPQRAAAYRAENNLGADVAVPVDAVTASGSGLDPAISVANARLQAQRVADARGTRVADVLALVDAHTTAATLGVLGEPAVNVLELNLALDGSTP